MKSKALGALIAAAVVVNLVLTTLGGLILFVSFSSGPNYPQAWDPRVLPLVHIVEQTRGLAFKHPVYVDFLDEATFKKQVPGADNSLSAADRREIQREAGVLRALGIIGGNVDLLQQMQQLGGSGIVGLYSMDDKRIRVRGSQLTEQVKVTLVHELTHALQDQQFNVAHQDQVAAASTTEDESAFRALFEGDAVRIETEYRDSLPAATRQALDALDQADQKKFEAAIANVPGFVTVGFQAPYLLGDALVGRAEDKGGNGGVDQLFQHPPTQMIQAMDPWLAGAEWSGPKVTEPALNKGEKLNDRTVFGSFDLYLLLAERLPYADALRAADGWGNDSELDYSRGSTACIRTSFVGRDAGSTAAIGDALTRWAEGAGSAASVKVSTDAVVLDACDPGTGATVGTDHSLDAAYLLSARNAAERETEKAGAPQTMAVCFANAVVDTLPLADLRRMDASGPTDADQAALAKLARGCRGGGSQSSGAPTTSV